MKTILVIDDEQELREGIAEILEFEGNKTLLASNGYEGIEKALSSLPDLILCDIMMPELDGFAVLERLRKVPALSVVPFIFLTAMAERDDQRKGFELGADDFLIKPFTRMELLNAIDARLIKTENLRIHTENLVEKVSRNVVRSVPHEFLTPLNAILGFSKIIHEEAVNLPPHDIAEMAGQINANGNYLFDIFQKYLLYIDIEVNKPKRSFKLEKNLSEKIDTIVKEIAGKYDRHRDLRLSLSEGHIGIIEDWFFSALKELIDNAFKFSSSGQIVSIATNLKQTVFHFSIQDCGRGFPVKSMDEVNAFLQFDRDFYEQQGIGLGLFLAKRIIQFHGGRLEIDSTPKQGTTMSFEIPVKLDL